MVQSVIDLITLIAPAYGLDPLLVRAVVQKESSGYTWAWNPEPQYRYYWDVRTHAPFRKLVEGESLSERPPKDFPALSGDPDQEWWAQSASWGLMQVMGAVARELGYKESYLTALCDPQIGLRYGCLHLRNMLRWAKDDPFKALMAYNGGKGSALARSNPGYAEAVLAIQKGLV